VYLWELFEDKSYTRQRYWEWVSLPNNNPDDYSARYWDNEEVRNLSVAIKEILETRAVKWAITNKLNSTFTIFHLKNNYKESWKDKTETEITWKDWKDLIPNINSTQLQNIANEMLELN
jgi:hypothetical protein